MSNTHIGKTVYMAQGLPATHDTAGFEALSGDWVKVSGVGVIPRFGITHANIDIPDLETGEDAGKKGAFSGNNGTFSFRKISGDAGQALCKSIAESFPGEVSIKVVRGSGVNNAPAAGDPVEYAQGYLHSYNPFEKSNTTYEGFEVGFKQNKTAIESTEPA